MVSDGIPARGDPAVVRPAPDVARYMARRRYVPLGIPLLKPVAAASGATACRDGIAVTIDGRPAATALLADRLGRPLPVRSEEHTSELQSLMRISYAVFCLKKKKININIKLESISARYITSI